MVKLKPTLAFYLPLLLCLCTSANAQPNQSIDFWSDEPDPRFTQERSRVAAATKQMLDGLHVPTGEAGRSLEHWRADMDLKSALRDFDVEVIEAKRQLNTDVIGQVIAGANLIARQFPDQRLIRQTVVVSGEPDPALRWVCDKRGILVAAVPAPWCRPVDAAATNDHRS